MNYKVMSSDGNDSIFKFNGPFRMISQDQKLDNGEYIENIELEAEEIGDNKIFKSENHGEKITL